MRIFRLLALLLSPTALIAADRAAEFSKFADRFVDEYLAWRPAEGVALGLHEYDGKMTDFSKRSIDAELTRLRKAERALALVDDEHFDAQMRSDYELLRSTIRKERFRF